MLTEEETSELNLLCENYKPFDYYIQRLKQENTFLLSQITHELRNPLTFINSTAQLLESRYPEVKNMKYWNQLTSDIKDMVSLLNDLSDYNHSAVLNIADADLQKVLKDLMDDVLHSFKKKKLSLTIHTSQTSMKNLEHYPCDIIKMKQAFTNILKNACEAVSKKGCIDIHINADPEMLCQYIDGLTYLTIVVSYNGPRIPEESIEKLFDPFFSSKPDGTEIGLPITKNIIQAHGGKIFVISDEKQTCFKVLLPLQL